MRSGIHCLSNAHHSLRKNEALRTEDHAQEAIVLSEGSHCRLLESGLGHSVHMAPK